MRALLEEALEALGESEPGLRARILGYLVGTPPYNLSVEQRDGMSQRALALARASGDPVALETTLADAEAHIREGFELGSAAQHPATGPIFWGQSLWLAQERGDADALDRGITAMVETIGTDWLSGATSTILDSLVAHVELLRGRREPARQTLLELPAEALGGLPRDEHWLTMLSSFAELSASLGEGGHAQAVYDLLLPYARRNAVHDLLRTDRGAVAHYLGILAAVLDRPGQAQAHFEVALEMNARMGARAYLARTRAEYAAWLLRRGRPGDRARARELRDAARRRALRRRVACGGGARIRQHRPGRPKAHRERHGGGRHDVGERQSDRSSATRETSWARWCE
jgi:hypothetical protein